LADFVDLVVKYGGFGFRFSQKRTFSTQPSAGQMHGAPGDSDYFGVVMVVVTLADGMAAVSV
jgi:hypothetical protein